MIELGGLLRMRRLTVVLAVSALTGLAGCGGDDGGSSETTVSKDPCEPKGINAEQGNTGTCARNGVTYTVVNKGETLELEELDAKLLSFKTLKRFEGVGKNKATAKGTFVAVNLQVKNKTDKDQSFGGPGFEQTMLANGKKQYPEDAAANSVSKNSFVVKGKIPAGEVRTGEVFFDTSDEFAKNLVKDKTSLFIVNFSDADRIDDTKRLGVIRLYREAGGGL
jgi:Domain of unknown function (DUF4352)